MYVAAGKKGIDHAKAFAESLKKEENLHPVVVFEMETDDSWARDVAPTFLVNRTDGKDFRPDSSRKWYGADR